MDPIRFFLSGGKLRRNWCESPAGQTGAIATLHNERLPSV